MLTVRVRHDDYIDYSIMAELRRRKLGSMVQEHLRDLVREDKARDPSAFEILRPTMEAKIAERSEAKKRSSKAARQKKIEEALEVERKSENPKDNNNNAIQ